MILLTSSRNHRTRTPQGFPVSSRGSQTPGKTHPDIFYPGRGSPIPCPRTLCPNKNLTMLSRVADSIYWMARYMERAENLARLLLSTQNLMLDAGAGAADAAQFWQPAPHGHRR